MNVFSQHASVRRKADGDFQGSAVLVVWMAIPGHDEQVGKHKRQTEIKVTGVGTAGSAKDAIKEALDHAHLLLGELKA